MDRNLTLLDRPVPAHDDERLPAQRQEGRRRRVRSLFPPQQHHHLFGGGGAWSRRSTISATSASGRRTSRTCAPSACSTGIFGLSAHLPLHGRPVRRAGGDGRLPGRADHHRPRAHSRGAVRRDGAAEHHQPPDADRLQIGEGRVRGEGGRGHGVRPCAARRARMPAFTARAPPSSAAAAPPPTCWRARCSASPSRAPTRTAG